MPTGNGKLFLPVKAAIRKSIGKHAGDWVIIELYADDAQFEMHPELEACLRDEPKAFEKLINLPDGAKREFSDWIFSAKREEARATRIVKTIELLLRGETQRTARLDKKKPC